jgi:spectrin alpha
MNIRKQRLLDSLQVQQLFRDIEDEEAWIREKEPVAASTNRGKTVHFVSFMFSVINLL